MLALPLSQITATEVDELKRRVEKAREDHRRLEATTPEQLWEQDLDELEAGLRQHWTEMPADEEAAHAKKKKKPQSRK